jgi:hypothetical protein
MALNETYTELLSEVNLVCGGEPDLIANLSNVGACYSTWLAETFVCGT